MASFWFSPPRAMSRTTIRSTWGDSVAQCSSKVKSSLTDVPGRTPSWYSGRSQPSGACVWTSATIARTLLPSDVGDHVDLDHDPEQRAAHGRAYGLRVREVARVDPVVAVEEGEVGEVHGRLDDVGHRRPARLEDRLDVLERALGLLLDRLADDRARRRVDRALPGDVHEVPGADALRVRAARCGRLVGSDLLLRQLTLLYRIP